MRRLLSVFLWIGGIGIATMLVFSSYSYLIPPSRLWIAPLAGLVFPVILFLNIAFLWLALFINKKCILISIVTFLICLPAIKSYFPLHFPSSHVDTNSFKIMTYNVHSYYALETWERNFREIQSVIEEEMPDICCMQEGLWHSNLASLSGGKDLRTSFKGYKHSYCVHYNQNRLKDPRSLNILSKYPIKEVKRIDISNGNQQGVAVGFLIEIKEKPVWIVVLHLESNKLPKNQMKNYAEDLRTFRSTATIEKWKSFVKSFLTSATKRTIHARTIRKALNELEGDIVVCGDFNDTQFSHAYYTIKGKNLTSAFEERGCGTGITFNDRLIFFRIDHVLHTKGLKTHSCKVVQKRISDHYPVVASFSF